ncbi:MAG: flagellar filament capping protein FliD [Firmicutes bacterium]|nr:flagellar filament capping protein FliD [Bacillota bacterium]
MASIGGLSSSTANKISSAKRITGLASGLDVDSLVEAATINTKSKIAKQQQQKQLLQWQMDSYREISSKMIAFQNKYTSYASGTNLRNSSFFSKSLISVLGENSKYVSISGTSNSAETMSIAAVEQLAKNTSYVSSKNVSSMKLDGSEVTGNEKFTDSLLEGGSLVVSFGGSKYTISLPSEKEYGTADEVVEELNKALADIDVGKTGEKLSNKIKFTLSDSKKIGITYASEEAASDGDTIEIKDGSENVLSALGFKKEDKVTGFGNTLEGRNKLTEAHLEKYQYERGFAEMLAGNPTKNDDGTLKYPEAKKIMFKYNGTSAEIKMPTQENTDIFKKDSKGNVSVDMEKLGDYLNTELNKAFGSGRIKAEYDESSKSFSFKTLNTNDGTEDTTSELKITGGSSDVLRALGFESGASNRLNLDTSLSKSGLNGFNKSNGNNYDLKKDGKQNDYVINIKNNKTGEIVSISKTVDGKDFDENTSLNDIIKAVNASDANVQISYLSTSDKFSIVSKENGASGDFAIVGAIDENGAEKADDGSFTLGEAIFGKGLGRVDENGNHVDSGDYTATMGQDAILYVDFDGDGGQEPVKITRSSNTFNLDGLSVTISGKFGMKDGALDPDAESVTFSAKPDTDKIVEAIRDMINDFNEIIEISNSKVSEKRNRDFQPLTDDQRSEMSETEIENWEAKAKAGMLFNSTEVKGFTSAIRFLFSGSSSDIQKFSEMGITTSSSYSDHGKIVLDESKLRAAIENNLEGVKEAFAAEQTTVTDANGKTTKTKGGVMNQIYDVFETYAATTGATKGIFVEKAGSPSSPLSLLNNSIQKQMNSIDNVISQLEDKYETEMENAYLKYANLETYINNMNSQSSWLSSSFQQ